MSYICLHIPRSLLLFCYFSHAACTQITMHGFSFQLIFPKWEQKWVFSLLPGGTFRSCGRVKEMAASLCFLGAGCGPLLCLARAQQLLRQAKSTLATRAQFYLHVHIPTAWSRSGAASWQGYKVQAPKTQKTAPSASVVFTICPTQDPTLSSLSTAASFTDLTSRYPTANTYSEAENAANSASWYYIKAEQGYQNMQREKQKQHRQGVRVRAHGCKVYCYSGMTTRTTE